MSNSIIQKPLEGEVIAPGQPDNFRPASAGMAAPAVDVRISVNTIAWLSENDPEIDFFKNWNQKWNSLKSETGQGGFK